MTTISIAGPALRRGRILRFPTREELRAMLDRPSVAITAMILAFLLGVTVIGAVVFLAWQGKDSNVINTLITAATMGLAGMLGARWRGRGSKGGTDDA